MRRLLFAVVLLASCDRADPERSRFIADVRQELETQLPDYSTTRFRNVHLTKEVGTLCGELNTVTPAGGYSGWTPFLAIGSEVVIQWGESPRANPCPGGDPSYSSEDASSLLKPE